MPLALNVFRVFQTTDERLTIFCCDFFKTSKDMVGKFDAVFDRGAFEAIDEVDRDRYADVMFNILENDFRYLLQGSEYDEKNFKGPPRCVPREQVHKLFTRTLPQG
jgi:thiopurine S-methyltransferase